MEMLPPLPSFDSMMEITKNIEVEVESEEQKFLFVFKVKLDVTYDPEAQEIVIECTEERLDNVPEE